MGWLALILFLLCTAGAAAAWWRSRRLRPRAAGHPFRGDAGDAEELRTLLSGPHRLLYRGQSRFQQVLLLEAPELRLYLDGQLQFSAADEAWYHEALVHPAMALAPSRARVLIAGGGDGLALREVLRYSDVQAVDLVDIDPLVLKLARHHPALVRLNGGAFRDPRVRTRVQDAAEFLATARVPYDVMVADFPDPADSQLARLYSREFFSRMLACLSPAGLLVVQATSPAAAPRTYWSVACTLAAIGLHTLSYHVEVPSFGDWGFHLAARIPLSAAAIRSRVPCRALGDLRPLFAFAPDLLCARAAAAVHSAETPVLHRIYQSEVGPGS